MSRSWCPGVAESVAAIASALLACGNSAQGPVPVSQDSQVDAMRSRMDDPAGEAESAASAAFEAPRARRDKPPAETIVIRPPETLLPAPPVRAPTIITQQDEGFWRRPIASWVAKLAADADSRLREGDRVIFGGVLKKFADAVPGLGVLRGVVSSVTFSEHPGTMKLEGTGSVTGKALTGSLDFVFRQAILTLAIDSYHGQAPSGQYVPPKLTSPLSTFGCPFVIDPQTGAKTAATLQPADDGGWHMNRCRWLVTGYDVTLDYLAGNPIPVVGQVTYFKAALPDATGLPVAKYSASLLPITDGKVWFQQWATYWSGPPGWEIWKSLAPYGIDLATFEVEITKLLGPALPAPSPLPPAQTTPPKK